MPRSNSEETYRRLGSTSLAVTQALILLVAVVGVGIASGEYVIIPVLGGAGLVTIVGGTLAYRALAGRAQRRSQR